ncbi:MAG: DNA cytosine methyltransferase [Kiritimatiellae bacterium]|nr:DNA cytosine methyltransferase [Kiritimatiellia bacterium]
MTQHHAYYNEIDPYAADWLENLIRAGHIAPGVVDRRSIVDVAPSDLAGFTQCHFFAGVGVWSLALRQTGWRDDWRIWTGSCPCQPFSAAGKGVGFDDERHLWPAWHYLVEQCRPPVVIGEQVASADALVWWDLVQADLEATDYSAGAADLCAAGVGAPHIRQRLWWAGYANEGRSGRHGRAVLGSQGSAGWGLRGEFGGAESAGAVGELAYGGGARLEGRPRAERANECLAGQSGLVGGMADDGFLGTQRGAIARGRDSRSDAQQRAGSSGSGVVGGMADDDGSQHALLRPRQDDPVEDLWGGSAGGLERHVAGRHEGQSGGALAGFWANAEWIPCRDGKWRPVEPGTFPLAHGAPARVGRLRAYGNAIVAPLAAEWVRVVMECMP